jgi:RNA polymerase sigma-70 factor (ECF subfamily)
MGNLMDTSVSGPFEARYLAFLQTVTNLRPSLHRYCARMTGSVLDGEDVVQETLFEAYRKLDTYDDSRPLSPWLFRIAHNRSIDFLRRRGVRQEAEAASVGPDFVLPVDPPGPGLGRAVEHLVTCLPPKERACVLLKDVFDYTLEEIAELADTTVGGVKAALNRGRSKLAQHTKGPVAPPPPSPDFVKLLHLYVDRFNRRDWDGLRELIRADARLQVADAFAGQMANSPYFRNYDRLAASWRLAAGQVDGESVVVSLWKDKEAWTPLSFVRLEVSDGRIVKIVDYAHCPWVFAAASRVELK